MDLDAELGSGFDDVNGGLELSVVLGGLGGEGERGGEAFEMGEAAGERGGGEGEDSGAERRRGRGGGEGESDGGELAGGVCENHGGYNGQVCVCVRAKSDCGNS